MQPFDNLTLRTARLQLRPLCPSDAEALLAVHADAAVMRYSNEPPWRSIERANALVEQSLRGMRRGSHLCLGIVPRDADGVVGTCTLYSIVASSRRAEIGFILGAPAWHRGYMSEALAALIGYAFLELHLNRLEADADPRNERSIATLERLGFVREGLLRERWIIGEEKSDAALRPLAQRLGGVRTHARLTRPASGAPEASGAVFGPTGGAVSRSRVPLRPKAGRAPGHPITLLRRRGTIQDTIVRSARRHAMAMPREDAR